jgi:hypothetical protein
VSLIVGFAAAVTSCIVAWRIKRPYGDRNEFDPHVSLIPSETRLQRTDKETRYPIA